MEELLQSVGVGPDVIDVFRDNKIEVEDLRSLSDSDLKDLIPQIGPRNRLKAKIQAMESSKDNLVVTEAHRSVLASIERDAQELDSENDEMFRSFSPGDQSSTASGSSGGKGATAGGSSGDKAGAGSGSSRKSNDPPRDLSDRDVQSEDDEGPSSKRRRAESAASGKYDLIAELKAVGGAGQLLVDVYKAKNKFNDSNRSSLAKLVIGRETSGDLNKRLTRDRAKFLAEKIVETFPNEQFQTWFRIETRPNGTGKIVKGRLMRRFYTQRRQYKKLGVIFNNSDSELEEDEDQPGSDDDLSDSVTESVPWLENKNVTPWTRVVSTWTATSKKRLKELQQPVLVEESSEETSGTLKKGKKSQTVTRKKLRTTNEKVASYSQRFPQFLEPQGWTLLEIDFEFYQKDALLKLDLEYDKLEAFVLSKLKDLNPDYLYDDFHNKSKSERSAFVFVSLSKLFPVQTLGAGKKKDCSWRPSRQEMRDGFLLHVKGYGDMKTVLQARKLKLERLKLTAQPLPIVVGPSLEEIQKSIVKFDECEYSVETPLKAVDVAFKAYHALHACYPAESEPLWTFLQKGVYKFTTKWDKFFDSTENLVKEYSKFKL